MRRVTSLCSQCYAQVPAALSYEVGAVVLTKKCPTHGRSEVLIDPDTAAFQEMYARFVEEVILDDLGPAPTMMLPDGRELNFVHAALLQARGKEGS